jgi:hypothetical protein
MNKYNIGDTVYWVESSTHRNQTVRCPMCFGKRYVSIILGDDSVEKIACGFCERGMERSSGTATVWKADAVIKSGVISGLSMKSGVVYEIGYRNLEECYVYADNIEAEVKRKLEFEKVKRRADNWFKDSFIRCKKKQVWSVGYHKNCIKSAETNIEWHNVRLGIIKENKK